MSTVLVLSSMVARGHVGLAATVPALQRLGHETISLPTVVLSNHPGYGRRAGFTVAPCQLESMIEALALSGWLAGVDALITGYLPDVAHIELAADLLRRVRHANRALIHACDPVLGDDPGGLYVAQETAEAVAKLLVPAADFLLPNRFELHHLSGRPVDDVPTAVAAAQALGTRAVLATSIPADGGGLVNVLTTPRGAFACRVERLALAPHGTGDFLSGLFLGWLLRGRTPEAALGSAVAGVAAAIAHSPNADELAIVATQAQWADPPSAPVHAIAEAAAHHDRD